MVWLIRTCGRYLLGAPGLTTSKKLLGTKSIATRSKDAIRVEAIASFFSGATCLAEFAPRL